MRVLNTFTALFSCLAFLFLSQSSLAQTNISVRPQLWVSSVGEKFFENERIFATEMEMVTMPLYGAAFVINPQSLQGTAISLTVLYGSGDGSVTGVAAFPELLGQFNTIPGNAFNGKFDIDRLDIELLAEKSVGLDGARIGFGARYVHVGLDGNLVDLFDRTFSIQEESDYYLGEIGFGLTTPLSEKGLHRFFSNLNVIGGYAEVREDFFELTKQKGGVIGVDVNVGYEYEFGFGGVFSAKYRLFAISDPGFEFERGTTFAHGPEVSFSMPLNTSLN